MNLFRYIGFAVLLFISFAGSEHPVLAGEHIMDIQFNPYDNVLSIHVENKPLTVILKEIGEKMDCKMVVFSSHEDMITDAFLNLPLKLGIQRLAKNYSLAIIYQIAESSGNEKTMQKIREIWLFEGGSQTLSSNTAETTKPVEQSPSRPSTNRMALIIRHPLDDDTPLGFWAKRLFESKEYDDKAQSITELQRMNSEDVLPVIATVLGDEDVNLRRHAVESLKLMDGMEALQLIGQALIGDSDAIVRKTALGFFVDRQNQVSHAFLNTALKDSDEQIRNIARKALSTY